MLANVNNQTNRSLAFYRFCGRVLILFPNGRCLCRLFVAYIQDSRQIAASARLAVKDGLVNNDRRNHPRHPGTLPTHPSRLPLPGKTSQRQSEKNTAATIDNCGPSPTECNDNSNSIRQLAALFGANYYRTLARLRRGRSLAKASPHQHGTKGVAREHRSCRATSTAAGRR